jgi:hypothetical protein
MTARLVVCAIVLALARPAFAEVQTYNAERRSEHIAAVLHALRSAKPATRDNLVEYVHLLTQSACRGESASLRSMCLVAESRRHCSQLREPGRRLSCELLTDVIVTNRLAESYFIDDETRYEIMNKSKDVRQAMLSELRRRYAMLVIEYTMSKHVLAGSPSDVELAPRIDAYCRDDAHRQGLSWQHCVAAIVWFMGTSS